MQKSLSTASFTKKRTTYLLRWKGIKDKREALRTLIHRYVEALEERDSYGQVPIDVVLQYVLRPSDGASPGVKVAGPNCPARFYSQFNPRTRHSWRLNMT